MNMRKQFILFVLVLMVINVDAQDFVYKPVNPMFGGDTFNYQQLLSSAQAQNLIEDPSVAERNAARQTNTLDDFTSNLERQLINDLSRQISRSQFGSDEGLEDGNYTVGDFQLEVFSTLEGLTINIFDAGTGEQTSIFVPSF